MLIRYILIGTLVLIQYTFFFVVNIYLLKHAIIFFYAGGSVYRWNSGGAGLNKDSNYPKTIQQHIKAIEHAGSDPTVPFSNPTWAINRRDLGGLMVYFYDDTDSTFYMYNNQNPKEQIFKQSETNHQDQNGNDINVFTTLPSNVVGMATYETGSKYLYVTSPDHEVFTLDKNGNVNKLGQLTV